VTWALVTIGLEAIFILGMMIILWGMMDYLKRQEIERGELHDRIMALTDPEALQLKKHFEVEPQATTISYVDEEPGTSMTRERHDA
jgi:uncharacterized membrane-anchored protein YhcB (DUF1043 family)